MQAFLLQVPAENEDAAALELSELGTLGLQVLREGPTVELLCYFDGPGIEPALRAAAARLDAILTRSTVPDVDWVARFREGFRAFDAPPFRIVPAWDRGLEMSDRILVLEPGRAFGTGTHESTRLCLSLLGSLRRSLGTVLDLGTGSGILAIAAARLGSPRVFALDCDEDAVEEAQRHARMNGIVLRLVRGSLTEPFAPGSAFDTIVANLTAPILRELLPRLEALRWRRLVASGFLEEDVPSLLGLLRGPRTTLRTDGEWAALLVEAE
jgi:ribosomal protein L11 methyltransferase